MLLIAVAFTGCTGGDSATISFDQLFSDSGQYNNQEVTIEGFYFQGFEIIVLSEKLEYSGFAAGHLIPKGKMIWISGGIPEEIYEKLDRQQMMGPIERYDKVRITGKIEYGGKYGHLGGYDRQITPEEIVILPWARPPA